MGAPYLYSIVKFDALDLAVECLPIANVLSELLIDRVVSLSIELIIGIHQHGSDLFLVLVQIGRVSWVLAFHHASDGWGHIISDLLLSLLNAHVLSSLLAQSGGDRCSIKVPLNVLEGFRVHTEVLSSILNAVNIIVVY